MHGKSERYVSAGTKGFHERDMSREEEEESAAKRVKRGRERRERRERKRSEGRTSVCSFLQLQQLLSYVCAKTFLLNHHKNLTLKVHYAAFTGLQTHKETQ